VSSTSTPDTASATPEEPAAEPDSDDPPAEDLSADITPDPANDNDAPADQPDIEPANDNPPPPSAEAI
jgi:hypothetical protein